MRSIERLCSKRDRESAVRVWAAAAAAPLPVVPRGVWRAACEQGGRATAAFVRCAVALGEVPLAQAQCFPDDALAEASSEGPCLVLGTVLEAAALLAQTETAGVLPTPRCHALLQHALCELPLDLADPLECAALAEAHYLHVRVTPAAAAADATARRRHLQLASLCGVEDATALLLQEDAAAPPQPLTAAHTEPVAAPDGVADTELLATHPLVVALEHALPPSMRAEDQVAVLCRLRAVSRLFYHCASLLLAERGLFVAPSCALARPRTAVAARPSSASALAALVGTPAWARLVVALDRTSIASLRATARWVRDAVDAVPLVRLALAHWRAVAAFGSTSSAKESSITATTATTTSEVAKRGLSLRALLTMSAGKQATRREAWEQSSKRCSLCQRPFGLVQRRHHCRCCARPVCGRCSRLLTVSSPSLLKLLRRAVPSSPSPSPPPQQQPQQATEMLFCAACAPYLKLGRLPPSHPLESAW